MTIIKKHVLPCAGLLVVMSVPAFAAIAASDAQLAKEVEALRQEQQTLRHDLDELKRLLKER